LKLKNCHKYIFYVIFISFIALLYINLTNSDINISEENPSRIIIKSIEKKYTPEIKGPAESSGIRAATPAVNDKLGILLLPIPDANSPIIFSPLL
jgi:hypothetical protein